MLRVFRLDPSFEFKNNPTNILYIDVKSEREITKKYVKKGDREYEFNRPFAERRRDFLYSRNYLVLRPKREADEIPPSDIDVVRGIPGSVLPTKFWLDLNNPRINFVRSEDFEPDNETRQPLNFVISIQSEYSDYEKLTVDENEALLCSLAYYYPRPLPRIFGVEEGTDILPQALPKSQYHGASIYYKKSVYFKGAWVVPKVLPKHHRCNPSKWIGSDHASNFISEMGFVYLNDDDVTMIVKSNLKCISIYQVPKPIHSSFLVANLLNWELTPVGVSINRYSFAEINDQLYSEAIIPCYDDLCRLIK